MKSFEKITLAFLVLWNLTLGLDEQLVTDLNEVLESEIEIVRENGTRFSGHLGFTTRNGFTVVQSVSEGSVEVEFDWSEVDEIYFPGQSLLDHSKDLLQVGDYENGIYILRELYTQRSPFFPALEEAKIIDFLLLAKAYLEVEEAESALALVQFMKPELDKEESIEIVEDLELQSYLALDFEQEATVLAKKVIDEAESPEKAAMAWIALGFYYLNKNDYREAWLCGVHPLLFDRRKQSPVLADAYLLVIAASAKMNRSEQTLKYYREWLDTDYEIKRKPFQKDWVEWFKSIDWTAFEKDASQMERFADLESQLDEADLHKLREIPVMNIPLIQN